MGLETGTYISSLNSANPTTSDNKTEGDDHIRLIKSTLLATFPNVTGAVTATHTALNSALSSSQWSFNTDRLVNGGNTQPSFRAYTTGNQTSGNTVVWNAVRHNYGSHLNTSTGIFTAPVAGVYLFASQVLIANSTGSTTGVYSYLQKGNSPTQASGYSKCLVTTGENVGLAVSQILELAVSETVKVIVADSAGNPLSASLYLLGSELSQFSGRLLG
jgi:hypothetical protein